LLLSRNFADGKTAGQVSKQLQSGEPLDVRSDALSFSIWLGDSCVADSPAFDDAAARDEAIEALRLALVPAQD